MKILQPTNNTNSYLDILIIIIILIIPLYAQRIPITINTSISILTLGMLILSIILFIIHHKNIIILLKKESLLWLFVLFFIISFIPSLILHPTIHGYGVFIEWILLPALTGFLLYIHIHTSPYMFNTIKNTLIFTLFIVNIISLIYFILNIKTFDNRLSAFYPSPNHLALFIAPIIPIIIAQFFNSKHIFIKIYYFLTFLLSVFILFFTNSFTSSISVIVVLMFITYICITKKQLFTFILLPLIIFIGIFSFHKIINTELNFIHNPLFSRIEIWRVAINHIQNNSLLNLDSIDNFQQIYLNAQPLYTPYNTWSAPTPHNLLLTLWISGGGFFSMLFFCLICSRLFYIVFTSYDKIKKTTLCYLAAFLIIILSSVFDTPFWKNDLSILFWLIFILNIKL